MPAHYYFVASEGWTLYDATLGETVDVHGDLCLVTHAQSNTHTMGLVACVKGYALLLSRRN